MVRVRLLRIGSDPELVFTRAVEWQPRVVPAHTIISSNRAVALNTFIGTDNHQATAELRPTPSRNVRRHLYDIAYGLGQIDDFLEKNKGRLRNARMSAKPLIGGEPLGGHIHVSMLVEDSSMKAALEANYYHNGGQIVLWNTNLPAGRVSAEILEEYSRRVRAQTTLTPQHFMRAMNYLLVPLERWVQPWWDRRTRNGRYGTATGPDAVRHGVSNRPMGLPDKYKDWAYLHLEYRMPSTWLVDPWLAYLYLGLAKYTMLNFQTIIRLAGKAAVNLERDENEAGNEAYRQQLKDRMAHLKQIPEVRSSSDLKAIPEALEYAASRREDWFTPISNVDMTAWRSLLRK